MLGSSLIGEDRRGKFLCNMCAAVVEQILAWWVACLVGSSRESSKKALVCTFTQPAAVSRWAVPALLLTHPTQLTGTIDHGYGWGCQGLSVHPQYLWTGSDYSVGNLALFTVLALFFVLSG